MRKNIKLWVSLLAASAMAVLILDTKTAFSGAITGVQLCLQTVIPSLLPFFVLSAYLGSRLAGLRIPFLTSLGRLCKIPAGSEPLLLLGFLGGYPIGVQNIMHAYESNILSLKTAQRMTLFCNNAGPAFLFGMAASLFSHWAVPWILWAIHIATALLLATILPREDQAICRKIETKEIPFTAAMEKGLKSMALVCGWVIIFRVLSTFIERWFGFMLHPNAQIFLVGFLELANGCTSLNGIPCEGLRFALCAFFLGFGGLCVTMQTLAVCKILPTGQYLNCKLLHGTISSLIAYVLHFTLFPQSQQLPFSPWILGIAVIFALSLSIPIAKRKKVVAIHC